MNRKAFDMTNVTVLKPFPILELEQEYERFKTWPEHIGTGQASKIMGVSLQGAAQMHATVERLSAGRDSAGHLIYRKSTAVALGYFRRLRAGDNDNSPAPTGWDRL